MLTILTILTIWKPTQLVVFHLANAFEITCLLGVSQTEESNLNGCRHSRGGRIPLCVNLHNSARNYVSFIVANKKLIGLAKLTHAVKRPNWKRAWKLGLTLLPSRKKFLKHLKHTPILQKTNPFFLSKRRTGGDLFCLNNDKYCGSQIKIGEFYFFPGRFFASSRLRSEGIFKNSQPRAVFGSSGFSVQWKFRFWWQCRFRGRILLGYAWNSGGDKKRLAVACAGEMAEKNLTKI